MADIAELGYKVDSSELAKANRALDQNTAAAKRVSTATGKLERDYAKAMKQARLFGIALGVAGVALVSGIIRNTIEAEQVQAQLAAAIRSTGGAAGLTVVELNEMAAALQKTTTYGDEEILSAQALLLTFRKIGEESFPRATQAILDMATAMKMDLKGATIQIGKALNDPILGVTALGRAGVQFSEDQKEMIKALVETGRQAEAQKLILAELESQFGGSAAAARNTLGGALKALTNAFGDLLEGDSGSDGVRGTTDAINALTDTMQSPETKAGFQSMIQGLASVAKFAAETIAMIGGVGQAINQMTKDAGAKSLDGLLQARTDLDDALTDLKQGNSFSSIVDGLFNATDDARAGRGVQLLTSRAENIERITRELAALDAEIAARANAGAGGMQANAAEAAAATDLINGKTQELIDSLNEEAAAYGLSKSALLEREKAKAIAEATNQAEIDGLTTSYDALIRKVVAEENATAAKKGASAAAREAAAAERELQNAYESTLEGLERQLYLLGKTGEEAQVRYEIELGAMRELNPLLQQELLAKAQLLDAQTIAAEKAELEAEAKKRATEAFEDMNARILDQIELIGLSADEQEIWNNLAWAGVTAEEARGRQIIENTRHLQALRAQMEDQITVMDGIRDSGREFLRDLGKGVEPLEAVEDALDRIYERLLDMISENWMDQLFGKSGDPAGGSLGGFFSSLLGMLGLGGDGGGGAADAAVSATKAIIPGGKSAPMPFGKSAPAGVTLIQNNKFEMPGRYDQRTQSQVAAVSGRAAQQSLARNTAG